MKRKHAGWSALPDMNLLLLLFVGFGIVLTMGLQAWM